MILILLEGVLSCLKLCSVDLTSSQVLSRGVRV